MTNNFTAVQHLLATGEWPKDHTHTVEHNIFLYTDRTHDLGLERYTALPLDEVGQDKAGK
jgi:hypothetical protein